MATKVTPIPDAVQTTLVEITSLDKEGIEAVIGTAATLYFVDVDNTGDGDATYVKLYDNLDPTMGTTAPDVELAVAASTRSSFWVDGGISFVNGVSVAASDDAGTAIGSSPTSVTVRLGLK